MTDKHTEHLQILLSRTALGDQVAFKALYDNCAGKLNGIAFRILQNIDSANEVLQEAFIQIWGKASEYNADLAEPMTWMASIVRYRAYDRVRMEKRRIEGSRIDAQLESFESIADNTSDHALVCEIGQKLDDCLARLEHIQQRSILLAYYYGFSREEISQYFNSPVNTVKSWLKRAVVRLQKCLEN